MQAPRSFSAPLAISLALASLAACQGDITQNTPSVETADVAPLASFDSLPAHAYTAKVKTILTGATVNANELAAVQADPNALRALIAQWQTMPAYQAKMIRFLGNAFQQTQPVATDFALQGVAIDASMLGSANSALLLGNLRESIARTVLNNEASEQPFNSIMSTSTYMLTAPLAAYYTYLDGVLIDDKGATKSMPSTTFATVMKNFTAADFTTWRAVTIRQPMTGETTTQVTDTATFKTGTTLILKTPRTGFFSVPTFFAQWPTNVANQARLTMNQTLIVALNHAFDGSETIAPQSMAALDSNHAAVGSTCYACHQNLDPMRQFFRQAYTISFSAQNDPNQIKLPGQFAFDGVSVQGSSIYDLGKQLGAHPSLPGAWVQKLCTYANDEQCNTSDPEFVRITSDFAASQSFTALVQDLFSSPIVTNASRTMTGTTATSFPVAKTDHLCNLLSQRLNLTDVCGQAPAAAPTGSMATLQLIASIMPANGYGRGTTEPVLANSPTLFFRSGIENVCAILAAQVVDNGSSSLYQSSDPNTAVAHMVSNFMGIEAARAPTPTAILSTHYKAAVAGGATPTSALQSTFVAACLSPAVVGIGR